MFTVTMEDLNDSLVLHCAGKLVLGEETSLMCMALQGEGREVVLDLREVETVDAAGLGALISLQAAGIYLKLENANAAIREVLRVTQLDTIFEIRQGCPPWTFAETAALAARP